VGGVVTGGDVAGGAVGRGGVVGGGRLITTVGAGVFAGASITGAATFRPAGDKNWPGSLHHDGGSGHGSG
jgi:hypothetical protein